MKSAETRGRRGSGFSGQDENWRTNQYFQNTHKGIFQNVHNLVSDLRAWKRSQSDHVSDAARRSPRAQLVGIHFRYKVTARQCYLSSRSPTWTPHLFQTRGGSQGNLTWLLNYPEMFPGTPLLHSLHRKHVKPSLNRRTGQWGVMMRIVPQNTKTWPLSNVLTSRGNNVEMWEVWSFMKSAV